MRMPKQVPPVQRITVKREEDYNTKIFYQCKSIQRSEISALPLSDIANEPSIFFEEGEILVDDPLIHFDIEQPIPPIEMCDVYCNPQMCDVYCIDAKERIIHGHIYNDIKWQKTVDNVNNNAKANIIHGHIYGDVNMQNY